MIQSKDSSKKKSSSMLFSLKRFYYNISRSIGILHETLTGFTCNPSQRKKWVVHGGEHDRKKFVGTRKAHIYVCNTRKKSGLKTV